MKQTPEPGLDAMRDKAATLLGGEEKLSELLLREEQRKVKVPSNQMDEMRLIQMGMAASYRHKISHY